MDRSISTNDGTAVHLKERNAPFQLNLDLPFAGMYQLDFGLRTVQGEPVGGMNVVINGSQRGTNRNQRPNEVNTYSVVVNLPAGANVVSLGHDPNRAPVIQKYYPPRVVPQSIADKVVKPKVKKFPFPKHLEGNQAGKEVVENNERQDQCHGADSTARGSPGKDKSTRL